MFVGGCAGSTSGSVKVIRILVLTKLVKRQVAKTFHPNAYIPIKIDGKVVSDDIVTSISSFFILFIIMFVIGILIISFEGLDFESTISAVATSIGNVGPGFGFVGPTRNSPAAFNAAVTSFFLLY